MLNDKETDNTEATHDQSTSELEEYYEAISITHENLKKRRVQLLNENQTYKRRLVQLQTALSKVEKCLEHNIEAYQHLCDDAQVALQSLRFTISSTPTSLKQKHTQNASTQTSSLGVSNSRQKLPLNPINIQEFTEHLRCRSRESELVEKRLTEGLSTIDEEGSVSTVKELSVRLNRLPKNVVEDHLEKQCSTFLRVEDEDDSYTTDSTVPEFCSTPKQEKLKHMSLLGLCYAEDSSFETNNVGTYINTRRKRYEQIVNLSSTEQRASSVTKLSNCKKLEGSLNKTKELSQPSTSRKSGNVSSRNSHQNSNSLGGIQKTSINNISIDSSPSEENNENNPINKSLKRKPATKIKSEKTSPKRRKVQEMNGDASEWSRPVRHTKPMNFKEPSLRKKMRRS